MHRLIIYLLLASFSAPSFAQVLRGRILDNQTKEPVPYANVYINNTFRGTSTNANGEFKLNIDELSGQGVVISCIGYESLILDDVNPDKFYTVYISPSEFLLEEVTIKAESDGMSRRRKLRIFTREFLGKTENAKRCYIRNLDDLDLTYSRSTQTLIATSSTPLLIDNKSLGYLVTYYLEEFRVVGTDFRNVRYHGYAIFKENTRPIRSELQRINANRKRAYLGSRMHFFRTLWNDELQSSKFEVLETDSQTPPELFIQLEDSVDHVKSLAYPKTLTIRYNFGPRSHLSFKDTGKIFFKENGYFDPANHSWEGHIAVKRVGDLLPYEYSPNSN